MFVIFGAIFGVVVGIFASSNPLAAIFGGLFFALVAWALTGFRIGAVANSETVTTASNASERSICGSRFTGLNGEGEMTPQELGAGFVLQATSPTDTLIDLLFAKKEDGFTLPLQQSVLSSPAAAKLYLISLYVSSCISYVVSMLKIDDATLQKIAVGMYTQLPLLRLPDGKLISKDDVDLVAELVSKFTELTISDAKKNAADNDTDPAIRPAKATELLICLIVNHYNGGGLNGQRAVDTVKKQGFFHQNYVGLTKMIEEAVLAPSKSLQKANLRWIPE